MIVIDLVVRGFDVRDVIYVYNYDFLKNFEEYVYRVGRIGRVGKIGVFVIFMI